MQFFLLPVIALPNPSYFYHLTFYVFLSPFLPLSYSNLQLPPLDCYTNQMSSLHIYFIFLTRVPIYIFSLNSRLFFKFFFRGNYAPSLHNKRQKLLRFLIFFSIYFSWTNQSSSVCVDSGILGVCLAQSSKHDTVFLCSLECRLNHH